jgi:hypothetical protein
MDSSERTVTTIPFPVFERKAITMNEKKRNEISDTKGTSTDDNVVIADSGKHNV